MTRQAPRFEIGWLVGATSRTRYQVMHFRRDSDAPLSLTGLTEVVRRAHDRVSDAAPGRAVAALGGRASGPVGPVRACLRWRVGQPETRTARSAVTARYRWSGAGRRATGAGRPSWHRLTRSCAGAADRPFADMRQCRTHESACGRSVERRNRDKWSPACAVALVVDVASMPFACARRHDSARRAGLVSHTGDHTRIEGRAPSKAHQPNPDQVSRACGRLHRARRARRTIADRTDSGHQQ